MADFLDFSEALNNLNALAKKLKETIRDDIVPSIYGALTRDPDDDTSDDPSESVRNEIRRTVFKQRKWPFNQPGIPRTFTDPAAEVGAEFGFAGGQSGDPRLSGTVRAIRPSSLLGRHAPQVREAIKASQEADAITGVPSFEEMGETDAFDVPFLRHGGDDRGSLAVEIRTPNDEETDAFVDARNEEEKERDDADAKKTSDALQKALASLAAVTKHDPDTKIVKSLDPAGISIPTVSLSPGSAQAQLISATPQGFASGSRSPFVGSQFARPSSGRARRNVPSFLRGLV